MRQWLHSGVSARLSGGPMTLTVAAKTCEFPVKVLASRDPSAGAPPPAIGTAEEPLRTLRVRKTAR